MDLKTLVRDVPDFPAPGVLFRDITPLLQSPEAFEEVLQLMQTYAESRGAEAIVAIESRGFLFGTPVANRLGIPFVPIRKPGKLPAARMSIEYSLEYGTGELEIHADALRPGQRAVILDDVLATGGTAEAAGALVELLQARVAGYGFLIDLPFLGGRDRLAGKDIFALLTY